MNFSCYTILFLLVQVLSTFNNFTVTFEGETIASVNRSEFVSLLGYEQIDDEKFKRFTEKIAEQTYKTPLNATLNNHGVIVPDEIGYKLNKEKFTEDFYTYFFSSGPLKIAVPLLPQYPKVDSELLASIHVKKIGQYITYFNPRKEARAQNIAIAVEAINNHVVFPGEVFSFNEVVGKRTLEKGYLPAPVFIKGKVYSDFGGGICQVSTTLFNAVDQAGVQILQRYSHSRSVPYVPPGRDANVSWFGADFTFKNIHNQPLLICAKVVNGSLSIIIESSDVINYQYENGHNTFSSLQPDTLSLFN
ncbi:VanW family protein [Bacillaceae bacterium IKA-2]|nr:VanW family protein [Bacillaceae bacterium IKA-2]